MARELIILPRFKRDYRNARHHPDFDVETLEYVFDLLILGEKLPPALREHRLKKGSARWSGFTECHLGPDLLLVYRVRRAAVTLHRIGTHRQLLSSATRLRGRKRGRPGANRMPALGNHPKSRRR